MPTLAEIAKVVEGELHGSPELEITGLGPYDEAGSGQLAVAFNRRALAVVEAGEAAAVVVPDGLTTQLPHIVVPKPPYALLMLLHFFAPPPVPPSGVHPSAAVHDSAVLGTEITVGAYAVIEEGVVIGNGCRIGPHCVIGAGAQLGDQVQLHAGVTLYPSVQLGSRVLIHSGAVIGGNGFGFYTHEGRHQRIPQLGNVVIEDDVEIGCNVCIDRATLGLTLLKRGTKLDNLIQIAHNVKLGEDVILAAQTGIAGSSTVGNQVVMGGQAGVGDHVKIGDNAKLGAQTGVIRDVEPGAELVGTLGMPVPEFMRLQLLQRRLRELFRRVDAIEALLSN